MYFQDIFSPMIPSGTSPIITDSAKIQFNCTLVLQLPEGNTAVISARNIHRNFMTRLINSGRS